MKKRKKEKIIDQTMKVFVSDHNELAYSLDDYVPENVIAGDTDSVYLNLSSVFKADADIEEVVEFADTLGTKVNEAFPRYMEDIFNVPRDRTSVIQTDREVVSDKSLFIAKKKYIMNVQDSEGKRKEFVKIKGAEIIKSTTSPLIQTMLRDLVGMIFENADYEKIKSYIDDFKEKYFLMSPQEIGTPTTIRNLTKNEIQFEEKGFAGMAQHAKASLIYNALRSARDEPIYSGSKIKIVYVTHAEFNAIAFPADLTKLPKFFDDIVIDRHRMWEGVQAKIDIYLTPAKLDRRSRQRSAMKSLVKF